MPEISKIRPKNGGLIAVWKITEEESFFIDKIGSVSAAKSRLIKAEKKRLEWLAIRALMLENGLDLDLDYEESGKPILNEGYLSISHCFPFSAIYYSPVEEIGVDIEKIGDRIFKVSDRFMNEKEEDAFDKNNNIDLTVIWGAKEAIYKKHGGETVHFAKNIIVKKTENGLNELMVEVKNGSVESEERLFYQLIEDFVLVYTS